MRRSAEARSARADRANTHSVQEVADFIQAGLIGDGAVRLSGISSIQSAARGDLVFVDDIKSLTAALQSRASALIAGDFAAGSANSKPILLCAQPRLAFARAEQLLRPKRDRKSGVHPSAVMHPTAQVANKVSISERVVIGENARIDEGTWVGAGCVIGEDTVIGQNCELYPNVTIYAGTQLGDRVIVHSGAVLGSDGFGYVRDAKNGRYAKFPQAGRLEIEDDVEIGANTTIDRGALDITHIGRATKIDNLVHVGHNVEIGENVVIAAQTGISGSAVIESNVIIGGQVGIGDHARIQEGAILGAQSGVPTKKVIRGKGVIFWGTPARPISEYLKELAVLSRLAKRQ